MYMYETNSTMLGKNGQVIKAHGRKANMAENAGTSQSQGNIIRRTSNVLKAAAQKIEQLCSG